MSALTTQLGVLSASIIGDALAPFPLVFFSSRSIGNFVPNVVVREVHSDRNVITEFPVETGTPISDHVYRLPYRVEITAGFSDSTGGYPGYVQDIYEAFRALKDTREPFNVSTGKRYYTNMMFEDIIVVTDPDSEYALNITCPLKEVIITNTQSGPASELNNGNSSMPQQTASDSNVGTQGLTTQSGLSGFSTSGPNATAGTAVGPGVSNSLTLGNAGGGLSFDSYMSGFSSTGFGK